MSHKQFVNRIQSQIARNYASCKEQMSEKIKFGYDIFIKKNKKKTSIGKFSKSMSFRI